MSYFQCPHCQARTDIFDHGGAELTAARFDVPFLGEIPLDIGIRRGGDDGRPIVVGDPESTVARAFSEIARRMAAQVSIASSKSQAVVIQ